MKKSNYFSIISAIILSVVLSSCASTKSESLYASPKPITVNYKRVKENYSYLATSLYYPSIVKYEKLDSKIKEVIYEDWNDFNEYAKSHKDIGGFIYNLDSVVRNQGDLISVKLLVTKAIKEEKGRVKAITICFNKENEEFLTIKDVSPYDEEKLSELCYKALSFNIIDQNMYFLNEEELEDMEEKIKNATLPEIRNFSCFTIEGDSLCIYFNDLLSAEYSEEIPKAELVFRD